MPPCPCVPATALRLLRLAPPAPPPLRRMASASAAAAPPLPAPLVQYVVLRRDLASTWPLGSLVAQACHACVAAVSQSADHPHTAAYCAPGEALDAMHKVVLEVKGEPQLRALAAALAEAGVGHRLWIEQPEGVATCLATQPDAKETLAPHFKKLQLCK